MTSDAYTEYIHQRINDSTTHYLEYYEPEFQLAIDGGTSHANILAADGSAVAITSTINTGLVTTTCTTNTVGAAK